MRKVNYKYNFTMSYGELYGACKKALVAGRRDVNELQQYGIDNAWLVDFKARIKDYMGVETDSEILADQLLATQKRDQYREKLHIEIVSIMVRVKSVFGQRSPEYERFGTKGLLRKNDNDFACAVRKVCSEATIFLPQLAAKNITAADIANLQAMAAQFTALIDAQIRATAQRDAKTQARIANANDLYARLVELTSYGKTHFFSRDESKYNDYVIYS